MKTFPTVVGGVSFSSVVLTTTVSSSLSVMGDPSFFFGILTLSYGDISSSHCTRPLMSGVPFFTVGVPSPHGPVVVVAWVFVGDVSCEICLHVIGEGSSPIVLGDTTSQSFRTRGTSRIAATLLNSWRTRGSSLSGRTRFSFAGEFSIAIVDLLLKVITLAATVMISFLTVGRCFSPRGVAYT